MKKATIRLGASKLSYKKAEPQGSFTSSDGRQWYRIDNYDYMPPFFMSIVNPDDLWLFISSTGGLTAGRKNHDHALFPYGTVDKITESTNSTGPYTAVLVRQGDDEFLWEPLKWGNHEVYATTRALYKSAFGDAVMFEETNEDLGLRFRHGWECSPRYGIHRFVSLTNESGRALDVRLLDGVRNLIPSGVSERLQRELSNLLDAYKRSEADPATGLGTYSLSATLTDLAEPSESLRATTVWSYGLDSSKLLVSERQVAGFLRGEVVESEQETKGGRGAYLKVANLTLESGGRADWGLCAELDQDHIATVSLRRRLIEGVDNLRAALFNDLSGARTDLERILAVADGLQSVGSTVSSYHHSANVLFNVMRGGYFLNGYLIDRDRFVDFVGRWSTSTLKRCQGWLDALPTTIAIQDLVQRTTENGDPDLRRLALEYLPLTFSRRHGDPSRPWNHFSIATKDESGGPVVGYQGNWRDIFQNWEALCLSYPDFLPSIITKFLNATTVDGYNPYRISQDGIDWETPEPGNPWANIGYWSDHQIVYLSRLLEHTRHFAPGTLEKALDDEIFTFADVPYRIKGFEELLQDPYDSITFDHERDATTRRRAGKEGADGRLVASATGDLVRASMAEKLLILLLAKAGNFVPGGGIWMNTQRPEWNDANNALVGWGLSVVTLAYLVRYVELLIHLLDKRDDVFLLHSEVARWIRGTLAALGDGGTDAVSSPTERRAMIEGLGTVASEFRTSVYDAGFSGEKQEVPTSELMELLTEAHRWFTQTLDVAHLDDGTYDSYRVLSLTDDGAEVSVLYPMLEGQVAGLSAKFGEPEKVVTILDALRVSTLYREDQHSYMLYPNRDIPGFLAKNMAPMPAASQLEEIPGILRKDAEGSWRFDGSFRNARDLKAAAADLPEPKRRELEDLFEKTFNHSAFTGRSGTFFAYEGLGSIYWHMVSKLLLAIQEQLIDACLSGATETVIGALKDKYLDIRAGLGFNKTPQVYGAFPMDPYSHSPWGQGAKQPGMTGQVKEEVITRYGELGLIVREGSIRFVPELILDDQWKDSGEFSFSYCGAPITVRKGHENVISVSDSQGSTQRSEGLVLGREASAAIFSRDVSVGSVKVTVNLGKN